MVGGGPRVGLTPVVSALVESHYKEDDVRRDEEAWSAMNARRHPQPIIVLGFDAVDVDLVRSWAGAGHLPVFQKRFETSAWSDFQHPPEYSSGTVWSSINTGLPPYEHDFYYFGRFLKDSYRMRIGRTSDLRGAFFWRAFAEAGRRIVLADVPFSVPQPELGGLQYWGWGQHDWTIKPASVPRRLLRDLTKEFGRHSVPSCANYSTTSESLGRLKAGLLEGIKRRTALLRSLITREPWDFLYAVFCEGHCAGHLMWHLEDESHPQHSREQLAVAGHALRDVYVALDWALGELLAACPPEAACVVFFSHGMGPNYHADHLFPVLLRRFHERWDSHASVLPGTDGERAQGWVARAWQQSVGRVPEAWRRRVERWLPADVRSWLILKRDQNPGLWSRMPGFALPFSDGFSALRVNLAGREANGRVQAGAAYHAYLEALIGELFSLQHAGTGEPAVEAVFRPATDSNPLEFGAAPDLMVWWRKSGPFRSLRSPSLGVITGEPIDARPGEHIMHGLLSLSHARGRPGYHRLDGLTALDIAPTVCGLAGVTHRGKFRGTDRSPDLLVR
jgi:predicted AlkP superfamily phosphohydrolase/phosphomutase